MPSTYPESQVWSWQRRKAKKMFAVIKNGGRQYKVTVDDHISVNHMPVEVGKQVQFDEVLLISDANTTMVGSPLVENAMVLATATEHGRGKKLIVFKYKSKKRYRHRRGHRQELTFFTIDDIVVNGKSLVTGEAPKFATGDEEAPVEAEMVEETPTAEEEGEAQASEEATPPETEKKPSRRRRTRAADATESAEGEAEE